MKGNHQSWNVVAQQITEWWVGSPSLLSTTEYAGWITFWFFTPFKPKFSTVHIWSEHPGPILIPGVNKVFISLCLSSIMLCMWSVATIFAVFVHRNHCINTRTAQHTVVRTCQFLFTERVNQIQGLQGHYLLRTHDTLVCGI